jgi:hypothetical protein
MLWRLGSAAQQEPVGEAAMGKWVVGILGTVIGGLLLAWALNIFGPHDGKDDRDRGSVNQTIPENKSGETKEMAVMGPLEIGINRQGNDFDAFGKPAGNEQLCAEMCKANDDCDSVTYVKSTGLCWMKRGVPPTSANPDMVSSVKDRHPSAAM